MKLAFNVRHLLVLTLVIALLIPHAIAFLRPRLSIELFELVDLDLETSLKHLDPELLVLGSASTGGSPSSAFIENDLLILTRYADEAAILKELFHSFHLSIESAGWTIDACGGTKNAHWIRFKKNGSMYIMQIWKTGLDSEQTSRIDPLGRPALLVKTSTSGFFISD